MCRLDTQRHHRGYWDDFTRLEEELTGFSARLDSSAAFSGYMPSQQELRDAGRMDLLNAVANWGGMQAVASRMRLCHR